MMKNVRSQINKIASLKLWIVAFLSSSNLLSQTPLVVNEGTTIKIDGTSFTVDGSATINGLINDENSGNSIIVIDNEGELTTSFIYNSDSIFVNSGLLHLTEFYKTENDAPYIFNADTIIVQKDWISQIGIHYSDMGGTAVLIHDISAPQSFADDSTSTYNQIVFDGDDNHIIQGTIVAHDLKFEGGIVRVSDADTLIKYEGDIINRFNPTSFVDGKLYQYDQGTFYFPVGTAVSGNRPAGITGLATPSWVVMQAFDNAVALTPGNKIDNLYDFTYWKVSVGDTYDGAKIVLSALSGDITGIGGDPSVMEVAKANLLTGSFDSYGGTVATIDAPYVAAASTLNAGAGFYTLGNPCASFQLNILALLEGGFDTGSNSYAADPNYVNLLDNLYGSSGTATTYSGGKVMYDGFAPSIDGSNLPIDLVKVFLLQPNAPYTKVDSIWAWVMEDGTVRDFETATETTISFCSAAVVDGNNYRIGLKSRNHLPVMSEPALTVSTSSVTTHDFTDLTNIYGAIATKSLDGSRDYIVAGEVSGNTSINAQDYFTVLLPLPTIPTGVYMKEDINFDTDVNVGDRDIILPNSVMLYYSTFPE